MTNDLNTLAQQFLSERHLDRLERIAVQQFAEWLAQRSDEPECQHDWSVWQKFGPEGYTRNTCRKCGKVEDSRAATA